MSTDLVLSEDQREFTGQQLATLQHLGVDKASEGDLKVFFNHCIRTGLDPFVKQIYMIERKGKQTIQTAIDGYRLIARRAADKAGQSFGISAPEWCTEEGRWRDVWLKKWGAPVAARVTVTRQGEPFVGIAMFDEYAQYKTDGGIQAMWATRGAGQLAKCFDTETEVLTEKGFLSFAAVRDERIMQVTANGLEAVAAKPFAQSYSGPMVAAHGERLDFVVTPNHDMVTTLGKVEARAMLATANQRGVWHIPYTVEDASVDAAGVTDADLELLGYVIADASPVGQRWVIGVSRAHKREALHALNPASVGILHSKGKVAASDIREIRSNFDKERFSFEASRVSRFITMKDKEIQLGELLKLSQAQARIVVDAWVRFDGHENKRTGVRRVYMSRPAHVSAFETLAVKAGYAVNVPRKRTSDISERPGYYITISGRGTATIKAKMTNHSEGIALEESNPSGIVWCVTVPSGQIVVRRNGFSMVCGNCAEALALRKAFPLDLSGIYVDAEMDQAANPEPAQQPQGQTAASRLTPKGEEQPAAPEMATEAQIAEIQKEMARLGYKTAKARADIVALIMGAPLAPTMMTADEAEVLIQTLAAKVAGNDQQ